MHMFKCLFIDIITVNTTNVFLKCSIYIPVLMEKIVVVSSYHAYYELIYHTYLTLLTFPTSYIEVVK